MKIKVLILLLFVSAAAYAQPSNYTRINHQYWWYGGGFDYLHLPVKADTALGARQWDAAGPVLIDTTGDKGVWAYWDSRWHKMVERDSTTGTVGSQSWDSTMKVSPNINDSYVSDFNAFAWNWQNISDFTVHSDAGSTVRLKLSAATSNLFAPNGTNGFIAKDDSLYNIGLGLTSDTNNRVQTINPVTGAKSYMYASQLLSPPISSLLAATSTNTIDNAGYTQTWDWSNLPTTGLKLKSLGGTVSSAEPHRVLYVVDSGSNAPSNTIAAGIYVVQKNTTSGISPLGAHAIYAEQASNEAGSYAIYAKSTGTSSSPIFSTSASTGPNLYITQTGTGQGILLQKNSSTGNGLQVNMTGSASGTKVGVMSIVSSGTNNYPFEGRGGPSSLSLSSSAFLTPEAILHLDVASSTIPSFMIEPAASLYTTPINYAFEVTSDSLTWTDGNGVRWWINHPINDAGNNIYSTNGELPEERTMDGNGFQLNLDTMTLRVSYYDGADSAITLIGPGIDHIAYNSDYSVSILSDPTNFFGVSVVDLGSMDEIDFNVTNETTLVDSLQHRLYRTVSGTADSAWTKDPVTGKDAYMAVGGSGTSGWDDMLAVGQSQTTGRTIDQDDNDLIFSNTSNFYITTPSATLFNANASGGSVFMQSPDQDYYIIADNNYARLSKAAAAAYYEVADSLREVGLGLRNDTTGWRIQTINPVTGAKSYANWLYAGGGGAAWSPTGNSSLTPNTNFLGITDNSASLLIKTNNLERLRIDSSSASGKTKIWFGGTSAFIDYGVASANNFTISAAGLKVSTTSDITLTSNSQASLTVYNGTANAGSSSAANSTLQTKSFAVGYVAKTGTYTASATDHTIECTANTFTVTLPTAVGVTGRQYTVVNSGSGTITIGTTSSQTFTNINGTPTTLTLNPVGSGAIASYTMESNNANWVVTAKVVSP